MSLEKAVIDTVAGYGVEAYPRRDAPGVYVGDSKLASLGLRIRRDCSYHGLALNVDLDLEPFSRINPTAENIAAYFHRELSAQLNSPGIRVHAVTLWETERACVRYVEDQS